MRWKKNRFFFRFWNLEAEKNLLLFCFVCSFFDPLLCPEIELTESSMKKASGTFMALRLFFWVLLSLRLLFLLLLLSLFVLLYLFSLLVLLVQMVFLFVDLVVVPPKTTDDALPAWQSMTMPPYAMSFGSLGFVMTVTLMKMMVFFGDDDIDQSGIGKNRYWYWCRAAEYVLYVCGDCQWVYLPISRFRCLFFCCFYDCCVFVSFSRFLPCFPLKRATEGRRFQKSVLKSFATLSPFGARLSNAVIAKNDMVTVLRTSIIQASTSFWHCRSSKWRNHCTFVGSLVRARITVSNANKIDLVFIPRAGVAFDNLNFFTMVHNIGIAATGAHIHIHRHTLPRTHTRRATVDFVAAPCKFW